MIILEKFRIERVSFIQELQFNRRNDLDWLRVLATIAVFIYHCFMFFNPWPWHVKNNETSTGFIEVLSLLMSSWLMPLFFVISGISVAFTLKKRSINEYLKDRWIRLGVPLVFGVLILTPPQVYLERISNLQFSGSFLEFYPHFFDGLYLEIGGTGNFAFFGLHLWYLFVLLVFTILTLPLVKLRSLHNRSFKWNFWKQCLLLIPLIVIGTMIDIVNLGGWDITIYFLLFLYGYFFFSKQSFQEQINRNHTVNIVVSVLTSLALVIWYLKVGIENDGWGELFYRTIRGINCWSWLAVILYLGEKFLTKTNEFLKYAASASMPFYIVHQPIILIIGYYIRDESWTIALKLLILSSFSFISIIGFYQLFIKPFHALRFFFGLGNKSPLKKVVIKSSKINA